MFPSSPPEPPTRSHKRRPDLSIDVNSSASPYTTATTPTASTTPMASASASASKSKPPVSARMQRFNNAAPSPNTPNTQISEDSFLDDRPESSVLDPDDLYMNKENDPMYPRNPNRNTRDSHDLSFPARQVTRDSLVTNMLSSLDKFSLGQISTPMRPMFEDDDDYASPKTDDYSRSMSFNTATAPRVPRNRVNNSSNLPGHGYSYSSDFEGTDEGSSRASGQYIRGRRSNSSSGFQSTVPRLSSLRERSRSGHPKRPLHSRGGKTSKSSSSNSIDAGYAQVLTTQRWVHGIGGRSSSFDYGTRATLTSPTSNTGWNAEFTNNMTADDYEAAPTPTIPGGPRRLPTMTSTSAAAAVQLPTSPAVPTMDPEAAPFERERKRSMQSRSSARSRTGTAAGKSPAQSSFVLPHDMPPVPPLDLDSAPAPHIGYEKSKELARTAPAPPAPPPKEQKPGFFRRIFGGGFSQITAPASTSPASPAPETAEQTANKTQQASKSGSAPPSRDSPNPPHVIQKKSSFFRRRKKSFTEPPMPPPPIPAPLDIDPNPGTFIAKPETSPVSSLREIMTPYLKENFDAQPQDPPQDQPPPPPDVIPPGYDSENEEAKRKMRGFSPDYEPSPNATIRTVKSQSALNTRASGSFARRQSHAETPTRQPPQAPSKKAPDVSDSTFFHDSSDEGEKPQPSTRRAPGQRSGKSSPATRRSKDNLRTPVIREEKTGATGRSPKSEDSSKLLLQPNVGTDMDRYRSSLAPPSEGSQGSSRRSMSSESRLRSATSLPSVRIDNTDARPKFGGGSPLDEPDVTVGEPTEDDRQKAQRIFDGNEDFIQKEKAAAWMGEEGLVRQRVLRAYIDLYDFANLSVLSSLRQICSRLVFRAETQQVDRILVAFSNRWCECNPNHGFKSMDVIHTMCYSIMLLNTDLHLADIDSKMTRSQFVKNTMATIKHAAIDSAPHSFERASILPGKNGTLTPTEENPISMEEEQEQRLNWRTSFRPLPRSGSAMGNYGDSTPVDSCGPLVKAPFEGTMKAWEAQVEIVLKDIYASIRDERLPLFGADGNQAQPPQPGGLSVMNMLRRSPSVLSKAPSESQISTRGRMYDATRNNTGRWSSKSRSRPRLTTGFSSSRTSFEDGNSLWSPAPSSATWSRHSLGRTQTSMSMDSFGSQYPHGDYQQSIGFANALSQAIIREDLPPATSGQSVMSEEIPSAQLLDDESLELAGPPWVKEGIVIHKHHLDGIDKKAKERNWAEVFAVVQKGTMSLFSFSTKSMRQKGRLGRKQPVGPGTVVGGGNWQDNATSVGSFSLRQTLASALPPPGYSRTRPNVWALSLPTGAVHLFQVGTPEISKEFVLTVNYWSARLSTHPLIGGISNIEYGWSDAIINSALITDINEPPQPPRPSSAAAGRTSMHSRQGSRQSSIRSSFDMGGSNNRSKLPGDKVMIAEWKPPSQSMRPSNAAEPEQLETLAAYVRSIEEDLQQHNQLRSPMLLAFSPRGHNAGRAMANWERKSSHLLREIVKFRTYVDSLQHAETRRAEIYAERDTARRAARGEDLGRLSESESDVEDHDADDVDRDSDDEGEAEADATLRPE